ncbi:MAG: esterase-like activity of phytase family protein, partial [Phaeodactylibacter sp.]|nr:esterase-like activity of phytase family protein [Phaeodactylibacter sp.]
VQADPKTDPGKVVFFDADGNYLHQVTVGALPDMIAFSPDGAKVLTANEGEPNNDYTIDPLGSVSVVDVSGEITSATVQTITFESYNDKKIHLQNKGIRIFGNNGLASVAEDMEPEYIAFSPDGLYAYVNCQENNGLAVLDLETLEIADIFSLGYKAHQSGRPKLESFIVNELAAGWPELGAPVYDGGQDPVMLGGFSGMYYDPTQSTVNSYVFYVVPDRGPNDDTFGRNNVTPPAPQNLRPFKLPDYQGRIVKFTINRQTGAVTLNDQVLLYRQDGVTPISGKGNIPGFDEVPVTYTDPNTPYTNVDFVDNDSGEELHQLPYDEFGGDFEGILRDKEGNFWMCDEYRPALYKFQPNGVLIERFVPEGTSLLGTTPQPAGTYGAETLPAVYAKRRANRGFEAIAYNPETNVVYAFIQSPIENPDNSVRNNTDVIRILGVDAEDGTPVEEYVYLLERNQYAGLAASRVDKIGDAVFIGNDKFLVLERDSEGPGVSEGKKYVFEVDLKGARNIIDTELSKRNGFTLEEVALLNRSASVTDEANTPFLLPAEFSQSLIIDRNTANEDSDFAATFGNWDMIALDPANQFIYIPHEVETGAGLTRYDRGSGDFVAALTGDNSGNFEADPSWKACPSEDFGALDPAQWTPAGTVLTAEEWSGNGRMFEWMNPLMGADEKPEVRWLSTIPSVSHEGLKFDADGNMYFIDENNSGSIYKFVPKVANDYSRGQSFVLVIDAYAGNPAA